MAGARQRGTTGDADLSTLFHPATHRWFASRFGSATAAQRLGWPAIASGDATLIAAPTGSGKTLAAFLITLDRLFRKGAEGGLKDETHVVYVSPLKALSNDVRKNLEEPLAGIRATLGPLGCPDVEVRAEVRTGDTPASKRLAIARKPPHVLVTTPESLYLLLTSVSGRRTLSTARTLIIDEVHALAGNRRGAHLALSIERLEALAGAPLQRIGLSATQKPIDEVARFLVGGRGLGPDGTARCTIVDQGHRRAMDLGIELPGSPLEAVMATEVWQELYVRLTQLIEEHRTTLIFVNTRRLAERVTRHLSEKLGEDAVASHHGSLAAKTRLDAEERLKAGKLRALVATASLELGIDIGAVDLVCQIGSTRSFAGFLQRAGRSGHWLGAIPKARIFPLSRDELLECAALLRGIREGELDRLEVPEKPLDVLAQQIAAAAACEDLEEDALFELYRNAYPYHNLAREEFDAVVRMLAEGFSTRRGRRGALIHYDAVHRRIRARGGTRLLALTSGGAIPDTADYSVALEPAGTFLGTVNEDFAVESMAGDIFQLGNASWRILRVERGTVRVEDAHGQPPTVPFWLGEAPARTPELSAAVGALRDRCEGVLSAGQDLAAFLESDCELNPSAAHQLADYLSSAWSSLGALPGQQTVIAERFFDEAGGMQLVLHSPRGTRVNRAWGLALRKRFCRTFNFELQAAATEDAIVLSLGPQHSFPLDDVFHFLASKTARDVLIQALLDAPMFTLRWRWNAARSLAVARRRGGRKVPPPLQRMEAEDLIAAVFPDQLACLENIVGDREVPDHPLVHQTIQDCLKEAMDVEALLALLRGIEDGEVRCIARDLPEPSVLAQEVLNAKPYAFLDDAPLEERRTQAVYQRRSLGPSAASELGALDREAIERVRAEAWPQAENPDEAHDALLILGLLREDEGAAGHEGQSWTPFLERLREERRAGLVALGPARFWVAAERLRQVLAACPEAVVPAGLAAPERGPDEAWTPESAMKEVVRGRLECTGPITARALAERIASPSSGVEGALLALEAEGCILRGRFTPGESELEWCDRRLLARIHRLTLNRLRAEIEPVSAAELLRFLVVWQGLEPETQRKGPEGLRSVIEMLDGFEVPAVAWEADVLAARVDEYDPIWLDGLCLSGDVAWGRRPRGEPGTGKISAGPIRSTPIALFLREHSAAWLPSIALAESFEGSAAARQVLDALARQGASFFADIVRRSALLRSQVADALGELAAAGLVTSDSFAGLRSLLRPERQRGRAYRAGNRRRSGSLETAGRWSLRGGDPDAGEAAATGTHDTRLEVQARALLRRWGVVFRRILERESAPAPWRDLARVYRRWEARGELRGGRFVEGFTGEQFALPEAVGLLRSLRRQPPRHARIAISAADPLNLAGIVTPGDRVPSIASHRVLLDDGVPVASLEAGRLRRLLPTDATTPERSLRDALLRRRLPPELRALY